MLSIEFLKTKPHQANAIDKRAIANLRPYLANRAQRGDLTADTLEILDESNYIIVEIEGYENIAYIDYESKTICELIQPIDRESDKLYPIQEIEVKAQYKRF
ncbi:MAG: hypothetical protein ACI4SH_09070 [Candidatus Scatosoma sp.]